MEWVDTLCLLGLLYRIILSFLAGHYIGRHKQVGFPATFATGLLLKPVLAYFLASESPVKNPKGCTHCGNRENEAEYCGMCTKNSSGESRPPDYHKRKSFLYRHFL